MKPSKCFVKKEEYYKILKAYNDFRKENIKNGVKFIQNDCE